MRVQRRRKLRTHGMGTLDRQCREIERSIESRMIGFKVFAQVS